MRVGVIGATVKTTPELVKAGATEGLEFVDEAERIAAESRKLRRQGVKVQVVVIHEGAVAGANRIDGQPAAPWAGPIIGIVEALQDTTIDLVVAGHTHRAANTVVGKIPLVEGFNAGASYSVAQLMVKGGDVAWAGTATRTAKNLGVAPRPDVQAIVDAANADTLERAHGGHRDAAGRHPARPDAAVGVGDGQHGHRRDARRLSRASRWR